MKTAEERVEKARKASINSQTYPLIHKDIQSPISPMPSSLFPKRPIGDNTLFTIIHKVIHIVTATAAALCMASEVPYGLLSIMGSDPGLYRPV